MANQDIPICPTSVADLAIQADFDLKAAEFYSSYLAEQASVIIRMDIVAYARQKYPKFSERIHFSKRGKVEVLPVPAKWMPTPDTHVWDSKDRIHRKRKAVVAIPQFDIKE